MSMNDYDALKKAKLSTMIPEHFIYKLILVLHKFKKEYNNNNYKKKS